MTLLCIESDRPEMLIWGARTESRDLGLAETKHCETCEKERPFKLILQYKYAHLWYVFQWVFKKKTFCCVMCAHAESSWMQRRLRWASREIPFLDVAATAGWFLSACLLL